MSLFQAIDSSASGMTAERLRMDVIADNLANASATRTEGGGPYMRKVVTMEPREETRFGALVSLMESGESTVTAGQGVRVTGIEQAEGEPRRIYDPEHPDANAEGYVLMPNVEPTKEMVDMITASRAYEANVSAIEASKQMFNQALQIAR